MFKLLLNTWSIRLKERLTEWSPQAGCFICPQTRAHSPPMLAFTTPLWFFFPCPACASSKFKLQECSCPLFIEKLLRDWGRPFWEGCVCGGRMASCRAGGCHCPQGSAGHARSTGSGICLHAQGWRRWDGGCHRSGQQHLSCWQPLPCRVLTPAGADPNPRPQKQDCMRAEFSSDSRQNKNKLKKKNWKSHIWRRLNPVKKLLSSVYLCFLIAGALMSNHTAVGLGAWGAAVTPLRQEWCTFMPSWDICLAVSDRSGGFFALCASL